MTEPGDVLLGRAEIERAFTALGERLARRGVVADVFVVGGAAMALAYDAARVTRDVDAVFKPHGIVLEEARKVADDLGLPYWWLNEQASVYISGKEDASRRRVFDHPGLRVMAASPAHVFAMKARPECESLALRPGTSGLPCTHLTGVVAPFASSVGQGERHAVGQPRAARWCRPARMSIQRQAALLSL